MVVSAQRNLHAMSKSQFNFQPFLAVGGSYAARVSIRSNGSLGLSQGLMNRYGLTQGDWHACLFFDAERRAIGIKFTQDANTKGAVKVHARSTPGKHGQANWSGHIAARAFLDFYGIEFLKPERSSFCPEWNEAFGGIVVLLAGTAADNDCGEDADEDLGDNPQSGSDAEPEKTPS